MPSGTDLLAPAMLDQFVAESKRLGLPIASVCLNILHRNYLKSDPLGIQRVADSIGMARAVGVQVVLLPFFGAGALKTTAEMDYVGDLLRELGPQAEKAGIVLGLEDTISARDNVRIMERSQSAAVKTYYDVGNSIKQGFDIIEEIRWLGDARICEVHLKDNPHYLGEGPINFPAVIDALGDIGFDKWAVLETEIAVQGRAGRHDAEPGVRPRPHQGARLIRGNGRIADCGSRDWGLGIGLEIAECIRLIHIRNPQSPNPQLVRRGLGCLQVRLDVDGDLHFLAHQHAAAFDAPCSTPGRSRYG